MSGTSPRSRYGGPKVRTGCITCKARHVKCDETRPHCRRCVKAGRVCEGYAQNLPGSNIVIVNFGSSVVRQPKAMPSLDALEQRSIDFFLARTAIDLAGCFSADLWSRVMMQVSFHESAIRHAIIALGALHENFESLHRPHTVNSQFAIQQYGKAIQQVVKVDVSQSSKSADVALVACIVFTAFECLQGHYKSAITHVNSGVKLLAEQDASTDGIRSGYVSMETLRTAFLRLETQALEIGDEAFEPAFRRDQTRKILPVPRVFASCDEARLSFDTYLNRILQMSQMAADLRAIPQGATSPEVIHAIQLEHSHMLQYFHNWSAAFEKSGFPPSEPAVMILEMSRIVISIMLQINHSQGETPYDQFRSEFEQIVDLGEAFVHQSAHSHPVASAFQTPTEASLKGMRSQTSQNATSEEAVSDWISYPESDISPSPEHLNPAGSEHGSQGYFSAQPSPFPFLENYDSNPAYGTASTSLPKRPSRSFNTSLANPPTYKPTFSLSNGIITPLYITCTRCRDPSIRRRALHLLMVCNRKEGIWDSIITARVAERIITVEEAGAVAVVPDQQRRRQLQSEINLPLRDHETPPPQSTFHQLGPTIVTVAEQIPESARVRQLDVEFRSERKAMIRYSKSNVDDLGNGVEEKVEELHEW